ncbi:hypothetical protein [Paracoccus xiamenensis]|uniref:hypothetical protein n=1 Tax=Paracoccus xiamenensis TaxID=2714901 RepID=UPI00140D9FC1|nr:hypothetical protein [Paracoccus xiamenensis]NHF74019.1 hypothetical protein [Paracoccus xiamenensis]
MNVRPERPPLPQLPLEQGLDSRQPFYCTDAGGKVPMRLARKTGSKTLYISFHGAIDRAKRATPIFMPVMPMTGEPANQLMIADPGMEGTGNFTLAWYAGYEGFPAQEVLLDLIKRAIAYLDIEHVVFMGSSGGGFASLFYSWHIPGSTCLAVSPQTDIRRYYSGHGGRYTAACWPSLPGVEALGEVICADVVALYRQAVPNTVVLLHSTGDQFHLKQHVAPLVDAISAHGKSRLILQCGYWGIPDHSNSVPVALATQWLNTVINNPGASVPELLTAWHAEYGTAPAASGPPAAAPAAAPAKPGPAKTFGGDDLRLANALTTSMLAER